MGATKARPRLTLRQSGRGDQVFGAGVALVSVLLAVHGSSAAADAPATKTQLCASCHGRDGVPSDHTVPIIWGQQAGYLRKQLNDYKNGDRDSQSMSSIAESLSDRDVSQIAAQFGSAKWPAPSPARLPAAPAAVATCQACHHAGFTGGISPSGEAPRLAGQFSAYLIDTMNAYADGERVNSSAMSALMQTLSPADRTKIADYLAVLR
ncbi:MAG: c-type cytochrome [Stellaceae bacterium]